MELFWFFRVSDMNVSKSPIWGSAQPLAIVMAAHSNVARQEREEKRQIFFVRAIGLLRLSFIQISVGLRRGFHN